MVSGDVVERIFRDCPYTAAVDYHIVNLKSICRGDAETLIIPLGHVNGTRRVNGPSGSGRCRYGIAWSGRFTGDGYIIDTPAS